MVIILGCRRTEVVHRFPSTWPSSIAVKPLGEVSALRQPPVTNAVTIAAEPVTWSAQEPSDESGAGEPSAEVVRRIVVERLRMLGIEAWPSDRADAPTPDYHLRCAIERMECLVAQGYPSATRSLTAIRAELVRPGAERAVWERRFAEPLEQVHLVNTMSRMPVDYQAIMVRNSFLPSLDVVLAGIRRYVERAASVDARESSSPKEAL